MATKINYRNIAISILAIKHTLEEIMSEKSSKELLNVTEKLTQAIDLLILIDKKENN